MPLFLWKISGTCLVIGAEADTVDVAREKLYDNTRLSNFALPAENGFTVTEGDNLDSLVSLATYLAKRGNTELIRNSKATRECCNDCHKMVLSGGVGNALWWECAALPNHPKIPLATSSTQVLKECPLKKESP